MTRLNIPGWMLMFRHLNCHLRKKKRDESEEIDASKGLEKQGKQVQLPEDLFKDKSTFENYWTTLVDDAVVPCLTGNIQVRWNS